MRRVHRFGGLTALVNYFIAKYRMAHAKPVTT